VDAAGTDDTGELGVHEGSVSTLGLRAGHCTMARTVVVQELLREVAACHCHCSAAGNIAINQEGTVLSQRTELGHDVLATGNHLVRIVGSDVGAEQLGHSGLLDCSSHGLDNLWNALVHLAKDLVALRLIVFDEVASLPEGIAGLAEWLWLQSQLWLDDGANHQASVPCATAQDAPHVLNVAGRTIEEPQVLRWEVDVVDLAILDISHALVVPNGECQDGAHHCAAVSDVPIEKQDWVGDLHLLVLGINVIDKGVHIFL